MESKIMLVFYGNDCLPYKDKERQVHYPIVGSAFLGASDTTKIRFYFDRIGNSNTTWVAVAKLPNGKQGSKVLSVSEDSELDENYAELSLDNWFTQAKGDVYIALQGYQGGVQYSYDSESGLYEISGTPTIQTTGSVKLAINYAPIGDSPDYTDEFTTYQEILAALGDKISETNGIIVVNNMNTIDYDAYDSGQVLFATTQKAFYKKNGAVFQLVLEPSSKTYVDTELAKKVDKLTASGNYVYTHNGSTQGQTAYSNSGGANTIVQRDSNGQIKTPTVPNATDDAVNKGWVEIKLADKQDTLVSGTNIKTINNLTLLGSGNIEIEASGGGAWGEITGNIQDQTDLQNELQDIRKVAEGKSKSLVIRYDIQAPTSDLSTQMFKKIDGTYFTNLADFNSYVSGLSIANASFNTQGNVELTNYYIIGENLVVYRCNDISSNFKVGDIILIIQTDVPDRWFSFIYAAGAILSKLETTKVDLTNYATKTELSTKSDLDLIAPAYDDSVGYALGDLVIYQGKLYKCTTAITTAESWDSTHWTETDLDSDVVKLSGDQTISGAKTVNGLVVNTNKIQFDGTNGRVDSAFLPYYTNDRDLGSSTYKWKDLYLSDGIYGNQGRKDIDLSGGGIALGGELFTGLIRPRSAGVSDIGTSTLTYKDLYLGGTANVGNAIVKTLSTDTAWTIETDGGNLVLKPSGTKKLEIGGSAMWGSTNNAYDLGIDARKFRDLYLSRNLKDGTNSISVADIVARLAYNVYTSPEDKTKDAATLALYIAYNGEVPQTSLAQPPREMLIEALTELPSVEEVSDGQT